MLYVPERLGHKPILETYHLPGLHWLKAGMVIALGAFDRRAVRNFSSSPVVAVTR